MKTSPSRKSFHEKLGRLRELLATNTFLYPARERSPSGLTKNFALAVIGFDECSVASRHMDKASDRNASCRRPCEFLHGDRIIVWTSPVERDAMPHRCESHQRRAVVTVCSIRPWVDFTWLIITVEAGELLVYGDGVGGPSFDCAPD